MLSGWSIAVALAVVVVAIQAVLSLEVLKLHAMRQLENAVIGASALDVLMSDIFTLAVVEWAPGIVDHSPPPNIYWV